MTILLSLTNSQWLTLTWIAIGILFCLFIMMVYVAVKNTKKFNEFRKELKVGDRVNYQNVPVVIESMTDKTVTFKITISKEAIYPLYFKS